MSDKEVRFLSTQLQHTARVLAHTTTRRTAYHTNGKPFCKGQSFCTPATHTQQTKWADKIMGSQFSKVTHTNGQPLTHCMVSVASHLTSHMNMG